MTTASSYEPREAVFHRHCMINLLIGDDLARR